MTKENIVRLYAHFCKLAEGDFSEDSFKVELSKKDGGRVTMGEMSPERRELIIADAKANKEKLEKDFGLSAKKPKEAQ